MFKLAYFLSGGLLEFRHRRHATQERRVEGQARPPGERRNFRIVGHQ